MKLIRQLLNEHIEQLDESLKNLAPMKLGKMINMLRQSIDSFGGGKRSGPKVYYATRGSRKLATSKIGTESEPVDLGSFKKLPNFMKTFNDYEFVALYHNGTAICFINAYDSTSPAGNVMVSWDLTSVYDSLSDESKNKLSNISHYHQTNRHMVMKKDRKTSFDYQLKDRDPHEYISSDEQFFDKHGGVKKFLDADGNLLDRDKWPEEARKDDAGQYIGWHSISNAKQRIQDPDTYNMYGVITEWRNLKPFLSSLFDDLKTLTAMGITNDTRRWNLHHNRVAAQPDVPRILDENDIANFKKDLYARLAAYKNKKNNTALETKEELLAFLTNLKNSNKKFMFGGKTFFVDAFEKSIGTLSLADLIRGKSFTVSFSADRTEKGSQYDYYGLSVNFELKGGELKPISFKYTDSDSKTIEEKF